MKGLVGRVVSGWGVVPLVLVISSLACSGSFPDSDRLGRDVESLGGVLRIVEEIQLTGWRSTEYCRSVAYQGRAFTTDETTCRSFEDTVSAFDPGAEEAWAAVAAAVADAGVPVFAIYWWSTVPLLLSIAPSSRLMPPVSIDGHTSMTGSVGCLERTTLRRARWCM